VADIVAAVDFSDLTDRVIAEACALAGALGDQLHLVHVAAGEPELAGYDKEDLSSFTRDDRADQLSDEHARLRALAEPLTATGIDVVPLVVMGHTVDKILEVAGRTGAGLIVVGSHGHGGLHHLLVGGVTEALVRRSPIPVVVVPVHAEPGK
jgi:nucleotide-binding universal stress UspA family protein